MEASEERPMTVTVSLWSPATQQLLCAHDTRLFHKMDGSFTPTQRAGCKCGWSAGLRVGHGTATEGGTSSLKCSRKWARCSLSRTSTPRPSNLSLMTRLKDSCHPAKDSAYNRQALPLGLGLGPHDPLCCNGLQSNKAQCNWFHAQLHDVWQRSEWAGGLGSWPASRPWICQTPPRAPRAG